MQNYSFLFTPLTVALSLLTATGIFIHDMKIDTVTMTAIAAPVALAGGASMALASELHTHAERGSLKIGNDGGQNPLFQPRSAHKNKKYITKRGTLIGHRALFGSTVYA
ncbi:MAG: hypothetical protein ABIR91_03470 [Candidatus Saccharimonadales bacterium]